MKKLVIKIFQIQSQTRLLHWQTGSYAEHNAFGGYYDAVDDLFDRLIEAIQGKYGRIYVGGIATAQFADYPNLKIEAFLEEIMAFFMNEIYMLGIDKMKDPEIENIVEEILAETDKLKYLLTLK
jgi:DNA-binding ferritin-like protein